MQRQIGWINLFVFIEFGGRKAVVVVNSHIYGERNEFGETPDEGEERTICKSVCLILRKLK